MKINFNNPVSFQRAFTTQEKAEYKKITDEARNELNIKETGAIAFDFNLPSKKGYNWGIGTLNSDEAQKFTAFLKEISGISKIQAGPESELAYRSKNGLRMPQTSPYSGSTFTLGKHTIDLLKLTEDKYAGLLDKDFVKSLDENYPADKKTRSFKTDYDYTLGWNKDGVVIKALGRAYDSMKDKVNNGDEKAVKLNREFEEYKNGLTDDVKKDILFDVLQDLYHLEGKIGTDLNEWSDTDRYLFTDKVDNKTREKRIQELEGEADFHKFCQFIAKKQHMEAKENLNKNGIKLFGDCLVCFSAKEVWANPDCFIKDWYTGGIDPFCPETNGIQPWNSPALNYDKLGKYDKDGEIVELGETGQLLYRKFKNFMELYDGIRMDAFWQYVSPFIYNDKLEGKNIEGIDNKIIKIMEKAANDVHGNCDPDKFVLELIGFNTEHGKELTKNKFPHVYSTAYAEYNENPQDLINNQGYNDGAFIIGATSHDNDSLVNMSRDKDKVECHTPILKRNLKEGYNHIGYKSKNYQNQTEKERQEQDFRTAKTAEIFTTQKQYYTLPDMFGMEERINVSGKVDKDNWSVRIPENYEKFYYTQTAKGYGMNFPKAYEAALYAKGSKNIELINKLNKASEILAAEGPMTTKEADGQKAEGLLCDELL